MHTRVQPSLTNQEAPRDSLNLDLLIHTQLPMLR